MGSKDFLVKMMELNEQVETSRGPKELKILLGEVETKVHMLEREFENSIQRNEFKKAKEAVFELTFYYRLKVTLSSKMTLIE